MGKLQKYKVLIPTSGVGVPLGKLTEYTNKTLIKIGRRPTLSYIIDIYPPGTEFVVTLGHFSQHVRDFLAMAYPNTRIIFVEVDKYDGPGSSLVYSMLKAAKHLQEPFVYHASDTIVADEPIAPSYNWVAGYKGTGSSNYASFNVLDGKVQSVHEKGMPNPDYLHIGWVGISNYQSFWRHARVLIKQNQDDIVLSDVDVIKGMMGAGNEFNVMPVKKWYDVGNVDSLNTVRRDIEDSFHILDKPTESIYFLNGQVIKFFNDTKTVAERVKRARVLEGLTPEIVTKKRNFYSYNLVEGKLMAEIAQPYSVRQLLLWAEKNLWLPVRGVSDSKFREVCLKFYRDKTFERIEEFIGSRGVADNMVKINGTKVPGAVELVKQVDFGYLADTEQTLFHGDFVLDNILKTKNGFCLLDWRQNFGGLLKSGDKYYDLAKLNHNLTINHGVVNDNLFSLHVSKSRVECDIMRKQSLVKSQEELIKYLGEKGYDVRKVKLLTSIIWLNMAPLHEHPLDVFLYYFGRLNLWYALRDD